MIIKKRIVVWIAAAGCAVICAAAAIFTRGWLCAVIITAAVMAWIVFAVRFTALRYEFSRSAVTISAGLIFKRTTTVKRSAILSQSRLYLSGHLICTIVRTAGKTVVLFCEIPRDIIKPGSTN